jgi:multiple sugar transport system permease protein
MIALRRMVFATGVLALCAWVLVPIYLIAIGALGGRAAVYKWPKAFLPTDASLSTLTTFLAVDGIWKSAINSVIAAVLCMVLSIALGAPAGYALARFNFRGQNAYRILILLTRAFPLAILALPLTVTFIRLGLYDRPLGVALIHTALALPFSVLISSSLFVGIPRELEEAAWVFGCSRWEAFRRIVLPLALPGIAATAIFAFVISWNDVFAASVLTVRERTLTAYLLTVLSEAPVHFRLAGGLLLIVPSVAFIFAVRRYLFAMWGIANR